MNYYNQSTKQYEINSTTKSNTCVQSQAVDCQKTVKGILKRGDHHPLSDVLTNVLWPHRTSNE